ncbi:uncharacterized protein LOC121754355 [Salvia splendens]|uniref:uncharacterized protein LOC121754355 n=1 Tax=Salvia splendens TaxID=180675 RepID=UPI001C277788|nr:uncharacterized protein LOC121754355 [Salvia splendens]
MDAVDSLITEVQREADEEDAALAAELAEAALPRAIHHRRTIPRDHSRVHQRLMADYFSDNPRYPPEIFRRHFRMSQQLFTHIATTLAARYRCFTLRWIGLSTFQKCTGTIRQLAYAGPTDMFDEYLHMGETTSLEVLQQFCKGIREIFGPEFLQKLTSDECQRLLDMNGSVHSFPGRIEDEGFTAEYWAPEDGASTSQGVASGPIQMGVPRSNEYLLQRLTDMCRSTAHTQLHVDLIEDVWARRGGGAT